MGPDPRRLLADRIYYGWVIAVACLLASMAVFGTSYAFGVFYDSFLDEFAAGRAAVAAVFGLQTALIYVGGVGAGRLVDRIGGRRVTAVSGVLLVGGLAWSGVARSFLELAVAFGVVSALGMAGLFVVGYATVPLWFHRRRGTAASFASAGLGIGLLVVPPSAELLIDRLGWRSAMVAVAAGAGVLVVSIVVLFADRPSDVGADTTVEFGDGDVSSGTDSREEPARGTDGASAVHETIRSLPFALVFVGWVALFAPLYVVLSHVVVHAADVGVGRSTGVLAFSVIGATTTVTRLGIGVFADRVGRTRTFVACGALMGLSVVALAGTADVATFLAVAVAFGVAYGGCGGLLAPQIADLFGEAGLGTLFAVASLSFAVCGLLAPPLAGYVFDATGGYDLAFIAVGLVGVAGAGCVALAARLA